jgi:hypothetical protein
MSRSIRPGQMAEARVASRIGCDVGSAGRHKRSDLAENTFMSRHIHGIWRLCRLSFQAADRF